MRISLNAISIFIKGILAWLVFLYLLHTFNSYFSDNPLRLFIIELCIVISVSLSIWLLKVNKNRYCTHKKLKKNCPRCQWENEERTKSFEKQRKIAGLEQKSRMLHDEEAYRIKGLNLKRSSNLLNLSPNEFEDSVATLYSKMGYEVNQTPYVNDGGKDAIAYKEGVKYLIECKRFARDKTIGRPMLQKLHAAMVDEKADGGIFVTTAFFTSTAYEYARKYNMELINGDELGSMYNREYPLSESDLTFRQMCRECGEIMILELDSKEKYIRCCNGHTSLILIPIVTSNNYYNPRN